MICFASLGTVRYGFLVVFLVFNFQYRFNVNGG
ncbi:hypothetical protein T11_1109 [Trichinella zimbabwensis]|uniref:Uncharacterized protein n=1 Tax=Trichinella zimbabwensis TaxID=268475 RepID=A0A0V1FT53_9BILA|nr:hypothetical protein T11_1109 [Trichinella zimbabwensis]